MENIEILTDIGFNKLEAEVYIYLLSNPPATAYKIGKEINKPTANVYKAIDVLSEKGAVLIEDNKNKLCKAVDINEFLTLYDKEMLAKTNKAREVLKNLSSDVYEQNTYKIQSIPLIFERFENMMKRCKKIAVIDAFPKTLQRVIPIIEETAQRGIDIYVEAYKDVEIKGADVVNINKSVGSQTLDHWKSQQLNLIIDGEEHLITLMDNKLEKVIQAVWSNNNYISCILHAGSLREQTVFKIQNEIDNPDFENVAKAILKKQKFFFNSDIPGFNRLFNIE